MTAGGPLVIRGGIVFDGLGGEGVCADVWIRDGRIERIDRRAGDPGAPLGPSRPSLSIAGGRSSENVRDHAATEAGRADDRVEEIDARGLAVCPGFIDLHSHSDLILTLDPERRRALQRGKLLQGITTEIAGNCGLAPVPLSPESREAIRSVLSWMTPEGAVWGAAGGPAASASARSAPGSSPAGASAPVIRHVSEYLDWIAGQALPLNAGVLTAHGPIRAAVLGMGHVRADAAALDAMQDLVAGALDAGAFGLSTGLIYPPGMHADTDELAVLARPVAERGALFTSHVRGSSETLLPAVDELLEVGRRAGCRVHHSHSEAVGPAHWGKIEDVLERESRARSRGQSVTFDLFPYHAAATMMLAIFPPWALEGGPPRLLERLADPHERARIRRAVESQVPTWPPWSQDGWPHNLVLACGYERVFVARTGGRSEGRYDGLSLAQLGEARGREPFEAIADLMIEENGDVGQLIFGITGDGQDDAPMVHLLRSPFGAIATDACDYGTGLPHPAAFGAFPRILARYVRDERVLSLSEAIRRMTSLPASIMGLQDRGRIAPGLAADIVVFDPETVMDRATFEEPRREAAGIPQVLINGVPAVRDGTVTGADGGRLLRRR